MHAHTERHHKVIRSHVIDRVNTTSLERGLAEELVVHTLRDLASQPPQDGFIAPRAASKALLKFLVDALGCSGNDVKTCAAARSGAITLHRDDVAVFTLDGVTVTAGDINFFASSLEWGECAFCSVWERLPDLSTPGVWKFKVHPDDLVQVPVCNLLATACAFIGEASATLICPAFLNYI